MTAIEKLEGLLARVQRNRVRPRTATGSSPGTTRAQPLALDEPLHLPPAETAIEPAPAPAVASAAAQAPAARVTPIRPAIEDEEPEITVGADSVEDDDDASDTGERVAVSAPVEPTPAPAPIAAPAARVAPPSPAASTAPTARDRPAARTAAAAAPAPAAAPMEARSPTPARAPATPPSVSEEIPTTTREAPSRKVVDAAPLPATAAVAKVTGALATAPRTFGQLVSRSLSLRPKS